MRDSKPIVAVVGFGYIGSVIGCYLASKGTEVIGIDTSAEIVSCFNEQRVPFHEADLQRSFDEAVAQNNLLVTQDYDQIVKADVILVTVGSPLSDSGQPSLAPLKSAIQSMLPYLQPSQLLILKSTLPPGTTDDVVLPELNGVGVDLCYCPERLAEGTAVNDLKSLPVIVGGVTAEAARRATQFWQSALGVECITLCSAKAAELLKLASNLWIDLNIALVNELAMLADHLKIDVINVINAANTLKKNGRDMNMLLPSLGVGGYCLTKDPLFIASAGKQAGLNLKLPTISRQVNDAMPEYCAGQIQSSMADLGLAPEDGHVAILGIAFKNDTSDCRYTPTLPAMTALKSMGFTLRVHDPLLSDAALSELTGEPVASTVEDCVEGANCVAYFAAHEPISSFPLDELAALTNQPCLIYDGRRYFSRDDINTMTELGLNYKGVGR